MLAAYPLARRTALPTDSLMRLRPTPTTAGLGSRDAPKLPAHRPTARVRASERNPRRNWSVRPGRQPATQDVQVRWAGLPGEAYQKASLILTIEYGST